MNKFVILHKKDTLVSIMLYSESDQTNICNIHEKEGASCKYYTSFFIHIQPVKKIKFMQFLLKLSDQSSHEYPDHYFYLWIPWRNYGLCQKQFLPQNYDRFLPQFWEMG